MLDWLKGLDDGKTLYTTVFESEVQAMDGKYVKEGLECSANNTNLTISISSGSVRYLDTDYSYGGGSVVLDAGEADRDRIDVIVWDYNNGSPKITVLKGSRWYNDNGVLKPVTERISPQHIPLAIVKVRAGENKVYVTDVYDVRLGLRRDVNVDSLKISGTEVISNDRVLKNVEAGQNIIPSVDNAYDLGSSSRFWKNAYVKDRLYLGATDVNVYRAEADVLKTDDNFDVKSLRVGGTEVISSDRVLRNIERFEPVVPFNTRDYGVLGVPPPSFNAFGFRPVYKAEEYDFATETWIDVTANYDWNVLTDNKGSTNVAISTTGGVNRRFRVYIDTGGNPIVLAVVFYAGYIDSISEFIVESSSYSDFSTDVVFNVNWTGNINISTNKILYFYLNPALWRRYVRVTFTIKRNSDGTMRLTQILGLHTVETRQLDYYIPLDWDYNRNIYPVSDNSKDLGSSTRRWRDLWVGRDAYIGGKVGIGTSPTEALHVEGNIKWGANLLSLNQGGCIELGDSSQSGTTPYIDFHYGVGSSQDYNVRLINDADGRLSVLGNFRVTGNVGIGTTSPAEKLHVIGNIKGRNIYPDADNTYNIGSSTLRWANGYFVNIVTGDIGFEELSCAVCGKEFKVNDSVVLKVRKVDNDKIMCVPVHTTCNPHELPPEEIAESEKEEDKLLEIIPEPSFEITAVEPMDEKRMYVQAKFEDGIIVWVTADIEASEDEITEKLKEAYVNEKRRIIEDEERKRKGAEKIQILKERLIGMKKKVEIKADEIKTTEIVSENDEFRNI